jgi:hypothetical protein
MAGGDGNMLSTLRRHLLQTAAAGVLVLIAPNTALAQWLTAGKIVVEGLGAIAAAIGISEYVDKWFQDRRCNVSVMELEDLKFQCQIVANSLEFEDRGVVPSLKIFLDKKDEYSWHRAKVTLGVLLNNGTALMSAVNVVVTKLDAKTYPGSQEDIRELYNGVDQIRAAVAQLASLPEKAEPDTVQMAESVLKSVSGLPSMAQNTIRGLQASVDDRRKVSCKS